MDTKQKKTIITVISLLLILCAIAGSYAYFTSNTSNENKQEAEIKTGTMSLRFADNGGGISKALEFGENVTKDFLIENTGSLDAVVDMYFKDLTNTYLEQSLTYKLEYKTSLESTEYINIPVSSPNVPRSETPTSITLAKGIKVPAKTTYYYKLTITLEYLKDVDQIQDLNARLSTYFGLKEGIKEEPQITADVTLAVLQKNGTQYTSGSPDFALAETGNAGLFSMDDDYTAITGKQSYYFRGAAPDNYVKFGGFYWRIIRINGDGSLRMIYDGKQAYANGTNNDLRYAVSGIRYAVKDYNLKDDAKYVGYMYGPANEVEGTTTHSTSRVQAQTNTVNSNAKAEVDNWYRTNMLTNAANGNKDLTPYLADSIFCVDRSISPTPREWWASEENSTTNRGFGTYVTAYGAVGRTWDKVINKWSTPIPTFVCPENTTVSAENDKFTVSTESGGNGALTYPVGLITADEIAAAGSGKGDTTNRNYYLYKSSNHFSWSLSPGILYYRSGSLASVFIVEQSGDLYDTYVNGTSGAVAPVINLKPKYAAQLQGSGTMASPYTVPGVN